MRCSARRIGRGSTGRSISSRPKKRIVLYLHEIEGLDLKDIAYLVDSNPVTVRTRLFYARREFYKIVAADGTTSGSFPAVDADVDDGSGAGGAA